MIRRILVPLDGCDSAGVVLPAVRQLVGGTGAVVHLLAVRPLPRLRPPRSLWWANPESMIAASLLNAPAGTPTRAESYDAVLRREHAALDRTLLRHGSELAYDGIVVRRQVRFGDPLEETLAVARREAIHLILVAPRAQHWWDRLRRPSLTQQLLDRSPVPVMVAAGEEARRRRGAMRYEGAAV